MAAGNKFIQNKVNTMRAVKRLKKDCIQFRKIMSYLESTQSTIYMDWGTYLYQAYVPMKRLSGGYQQIVNTEVITDGTNKLFITTSLLLEAMNKGLVIMKNSGNINGHWYVSRDGKFTNTELHIAEMIKSFKFPDKLQSIDNLLTL